MQFKYETEDKGEIIVMTDLNLTICELKKKKSVEVEELFRRNWLAAEKKSIRKRYGTTNEEVQIDHIFSISRGVLQDLAILALIIHY